MKNSIKILIVMISLIGLFVINYFIFKSSWYSDYLEYTELDREDVEILTNFDIEQYIIEYTNFNSDEFSLEKLYEKISSNMKKKYSTLDSFKTYCNEKILHYFENEVFYSMREYKGEEKIDGILKKKFTIYYFDSDTYLEILMDQSFDMEKANFAIDIYVVEESIDNYSIEF